MLDEEICKRCRYEDGFVWPSDNGNDVDYMHVVYTVAAYKKISWACPCSDETLCEKDNPPDDCHFLLEQIMKTQKC